MLEWLQEEMHKAFAGHRYSLTKQNCNHFTDLRCMRLLGRHIPAVSLAVNDIQQPQSQPTQ